MKTELKDVIHLYLGCEMKVYFNGIEQIKSDGGNFKIDYTMLNFNNEKSFKYTVKPILRRIEDMTEEESCFLNWDENELRHASQLTNPSIYISEFLWLLKNGFDLFGLIDSNQAIDRKTVDVGGNV